MPKAKVDRRSSLEKLRDLLAKRIATTDDPRLIAVLSKEYRETLRELDDFTPPAKKGSLVDDLTKRRNARGATSTSRAPVRRRRADTGT